MHDDTVDASTDPIECSVVVRPFARGTVLAYELVLKRTQGDRVYDRSLAFISGADARDFVRAVSGVEFVEARS